MNEYEIETRMSKNIQEALWQKADGSTKTMNTGTAGSREYYVEDDYPLEALPVTVIDAVKGSYHNTYFEVLNKYSKDNLQDLDPEAIKKSPKRYKYAEGQSTDPPAPIVIQESTAQSPINVEKVFVETDNEDEEYLFDKDRLFTPDADLELDVSFKDEIAAHYRKSVETKQKRKSKLMESKRQTINASFMPALQIDTHDTETSVQQIYAIPTFQSETNCQFVSPFEQSDFGDHFYSLKKLTSIQSSRYDISQRSISNQILQENSEKLVSQLLSRQQKVQKLLRDASKIHNKERKQFEKKIKNVDEDTQIKLKFINDQRKDALNKIKNQNRQNRQEKRIERQIQLEIQKKLDEGQFSLRGSPSGGSFLPPITIRDSQTQLVRENPGIMKSVCQINQKKYKATVFSGPVVDGVPVKQPRDERQKTERNAKSLMLKNLDLLPAYKKSGQMRIISPILPATDSKKEFNLDVDLKKIVVSRKKTQIVSKVIDINTDMAIDESSMAMSPSKFVKGRENTLLQDIASINLSESQQSVRFKSQVSTNIQNLQTREEILKKILEKPKNDSKVAVPEKILQSDTTLNEEISNLKTNNELAAENDNKLKLLVKIKHELQIHEKNKKKMGYKFLQSRKQEYPIEESETDDEEVAPTPEPIEEEKVESENSYEMPQKYTKAFTENQDRFNDMKNNIQKIFDNIEKPFLPQNKKKPKNQAKRMQTLKDGQKPRMLLNPNLQKKLAQNKTVDY